MGHRSTFRNAWVTGRPFGMYGSPVDLSKRMGHRSTFRNVRVTGRPFEMYGSPVDLSKCMGHWSTFRNVWVTGRPFEMSGWEVPLTQTRETMGNHGFGNFGAGNYHRDRLGKPWETMDLVTFGLATTTGAGWDTMGDNFEAGN